MRSICRRANTNCRFSLYDRLLTHDAQLLYPVSPDPESPWIPELSGNAILVNGKLFPYLEVEPRKYRFRVLNASNARSYHLSFADRAPFHQIGTDQGLLARAGSAHQP